MEEHRQFDSAIDDYERFNHGPYSHAEHVEHVRAVISAGNVLLHALSVPVRTQGANDALLDATAAALLYFERMDATNAAIHCASVRYSPITFCLARALNTAWPEGEEPTEELFRVLNHDGAYPEDTGR